MMNNEDKFYRDLIKKFFDNFIISSKNIHKTENLKVKKRKFCCLSYCNG